MAPTVEQEKAMPLQTQRPTKKQLQLADDYHKMKEFYLERYMNGLRDKILEYDQKKSPAASRTSSVKSAPITRRQVKKPQATPSSQQTKRRPLHKPVKTSTPKSKRLTLIETEDKLTKAGHINSEEELMEFRNGVSTAENLEKYTEDFIAMRSRALSSKQGRPLSKIAESREQSGRSRPGTKQIAKKQMDTELNPLAGNRNLTPAEIAKAAALALEKRCPRMDIPDLHCLRSAGDDSDGETEIARDEERGRRRDEYSSRVGYLRQMYQRAQANTAQAKRIIDNRDDDILHDKSSMLADLSNVCTEMIRPAHSPESRLRPLVTDQYDVESQFTYDAAYDVPDLSDAEGDNLSSSGVVPPLPPGQQDRVNQWREDTHHPNRQPFNMFTPIEEEPATPTVNQELALVPEQAQLQVVKPSAETKDDRTHTEMLAIDDGSHVIQPLNLNRMSEEVKLLEPTVMSTYWPNYLKVGKSKFSREESGS